jgi:ABC-type nickel/cobalt efflux system permease component RcnA
VSSSALHHRRRRRRLAIAAALAALAALAVPALALAHPLGNFTINHFAEIEVTPEAARLDVIIDMAEIPAFQERLRLDTDGDGDVSDAEAAAASDGECRTLADSLDLSMAGRAVALGGAASAGLTFPAGLGGLSTLRLECRFDVPLPARLSSPLSLAFADRSYTDRIGWREITAVGDGTLLDTSLPATSISDRLTAYPSDRIATPLDVRAGELVARPDPAAPAPPVAPPPAPEAGRAGVVPGGVGADLPAVFRTADLTPIAALLALATAAVLGAAHALTPGHGKTLMAAYLVGTRGTPLHAAGLGLSVTVSHTLGVLVLAAVVLWAQSLLPPDVVIRGAPVVAAAGIVVVGAWMLATELRRRQRPPVHPLGHDHIHDHADVPVHPHEHSYGGVTYSHLPSAAGPIGWRSLFVLGLAGGLIPSTSALIILLGSIAANRAPFGLVLVVAFGLGMAVVMFAVGLLVVGARGVIDRRASNGTLTRLGAALPLGAAVLVLGLGLYLTATSVGSPPQL